jgi:hypothetical protein
MIKGRGVQPHAQPLARAVVVGRQHLDGDARAPDAGPWRRIISPIPPDAMRSLLVVAAGRACKAAA